MNFLEKCSDICYKKHNLITIMSNILIFFIMNIGSINVIVKNGNIAGEKVDCIVIP